MPVQQHCLEKKIFSGWAKLDWALQLVSLGVFHITARMVPSGEILCPLQKPLPTSNHSPTLLEVSGRGKVASG